MIPIGCQHDESKRGVCEKCGATACSQCVYTNYCIVCTWQHPWRTDAQNIVWCADCIQGNLSTTPMTTCELCGRGMCASHITTRNGIDFCSNDCSVLFFTYVLNDVRDEKDFILKNGQGLVCKGVNGPSSTVSGAEERRIH